MNNSAELKNDLIRLIIELDDVGFLQHLKKVVVGKTKEEYDWADDLTESQLQQIKLGELQIQAGQYVTSQQMREETKAFFEQKRKEQK
jgi:hypothetical protein